MGKTIIEVQFSLSFRKREKNADRRVLSESALESPTSWTCLGQNPKYLLMFMWLKEIKFWILDVYAIDYPSFGKLQLPLCGVSS